MKRLYCLACLLMFAISGLRAQSSLFDIEFTKPISRVPNIAFFKVGNEVRFENYQAWLQKTYNISEGLSFRLTSEEHDNLGMIHYHYRQTYYGLDIEATMQIVHVKNGLVTGFNGIIFNNFNLSTNPVISQSQAKSDAVKWFGTEPVAEEYVYQMPKEKIIDSFWKGILTITPLNNKLEQQYNRLSWRFDFFSPAEPKREYIYVDAQTGGVIYHMPLLHSADSACKAKTAYRGVRDITAYYDSTNNRFASYEKSKFIEVMDGSRYDTPTNTYPHFYNTTNYWAPQNNDSFANDCHWAMEQHNDMYKKWFGRNGYDGKGGAYLGYVHAGTYTNAFWIGSCAMFGDACLGKTCTIHPLTSIDIVGHEFTHGVSFGTPMLAYSNEPGGINEGMSDIFGKTLEWYADSTSGKFTWKFGKDFGAVFRDMQKPYNGFYKGKNWIDGADVHYGSGLLNYFYYLIADGDTGTNEVGYHYNIDSLGFYRASQIMYRLQVAYLTTYSDYPDLANCAILAASDLFGTCSHEVQVIADALRAVGLHPLTMIAPGKGIITQLTDATQIGYSKVKLIKLLIKGNCNTTANDTLQNININMTGTSNFSSLANFKIYYAADTNKFDTSVLLFKQTNVAKNIVVNKKLILKNTYNNFWVMLDVKSTAKFMDYINITIDSVQVNNNWQVPENNSPSKRIVVLACKPDVYGNNCDMPKTSMVQLGNVTLLDSSCNMYDTAYRFRDPGFFVTAGQKYTLKIRTYSVYKFAYRSDSNYARVWIDFNKNGLFESTELVLKGGLPPILSGNITIPAKQAYGKMLMRIISTFDSSSGIQPCDYIYGSCTDFIINVGKPINNISQTTSCVGRSTQYSAALDSNVTYKWYLNGSQLLQSGKGSPWNILDYTPTQSGLYTISLQTYTVSAANYSESLSPIQVALDSIPVKIYNPSTIHLCQGQQTILTTDSNIANATANTLYITYDPSKGQASFKNPTNVYMYAALIDSPGAPWRYTVGNWGKDDGVGQMTKNGTKWQLIFNPLDYFKPDHNTDLKYIVMYFRNQDGKQVGTDSFGKEIFLRIDTFTPISSFKGVTSYYRKSIQWLKDGQGILGQTTSYLTVSASGTYQVQMMGTKCNYLSDPIQVIIDTPAVSGKISANKTFICKGQSVLLKLDSSFGNIAWQENTNGTWSYINANTDTVTVSPQINTYYKAELTSGVCPSVSSDSIYITIDQPKIDSIGATPNGICENDSALIEVYTISPNSFEWYNNSQTIANANKSSLWIKDSNIYTVQISDSIGCNVTSGPIKEAIFANPITINFIQSGHLLYVDSSKYSGMNINWYVDGKLQSTPFFSLYIDSVHFYSATITTANGCTVSSSSKTFDFTGIFTPQTKSISIYPNPSTGIYQVVSDNQQTMQITITDLSGRMIQNTTLYNTEIDLSKEAAGIYILNINTNGTRQNFRLMKY